MSRLAGRTNSPALSRDILGGLFRVLWLLWSRSKSNRSERASLASERRARARRDGECGSLTASGAVAMGWDARSTVFKNLARSSEAYSAVEARRMRESSSSRWSTLLTTLALA